MLQEISNNPRHVVGLVLGRFQPLHPGHLELISIAMSQCDEVIICIGSAQRNEPFTIKERHKYISNQLHILYPHKSWRLADLVDPEPMEIWPEYVKQQCKIIGEGHKFYRADKLPEEYEKKLKDLGFKIVYVTRKSFYYIFPDGLYRYVSSATEIRTIYEQLNKPITYHVIRN